MDDERFGKFLRNKILLSIIPSSGCILSLLFFVVFLVSLIFVGVIKIDNDSTMDGSFAYDSECNYENTMVTVMDNSNTVVLATVNLEDYIIGVACVEIGACDGSLASGAVSETYAKAQYVASKTWLLSTKGYNSSTKSVTVRASTYDQQWCSLENGCIVTHDSSADYAYPGNYTGNMIGSVQFRRSFTEADLEVARRYYKETYGELFMPNDYKKAVTSLDSSTATFYVGFGGGSALGTQGFWQAKGAEGKTYEEALKLCGIDDCGSNSGLNPSSINHYYANKSIYRLKDYCKSTTVSNSSVGDISGANYNQGGLPIPIYYQGDYDDVGLASGKTVASSGCGFTSTSMVVSYLTGKMITPRELVDDWSRRYYVYNVGMDFGLPGAAASHYNLGTVEQTTDSNVMLQALKDGHPVLSSQDPGLFTSNGHIIVLRGVTSSGKILVNDPNRANAVDKGYNEREFTVSEISASNKNYFIWPKKT